MPNTLSIDGNRAPFDLSGLLQHDTGGLLGQAAGQVGRAIAKVDPNTPFVTGKGDANAVDPNDVKQNGYGSCGVLSTLSSIAQQDPAAIRNMVKDNGDGTYTVTFKEERSIFGISLGWHDVKVTVSGNFDKGAAHNSGDVNAKGQQEIWPAIIEKAYAQQYKGSDQHYGSGVNPADVMRAVLGADANTTTPAKVGYDDMKTMLGDDKAVVAWTSDVTSDPAVAKLAKQYNVVGGHAYAVSSVYTDKNGTQMVHLNNPWGTNHVDMPYADFQKVYYQVNSASTR